MANRVPLIVDTSSLYIKELPVGDNLDLTGSGVVGLSVSGISTFTSGPIIIGAGASTGTANQLLQVGSATTAGGVYISGNLGIGTTNPVQQLQVGGGSTTSFVVTGVGSVGVGTTNPTHSLHVFGPSRFEKVAITTTSTNLTMQPGYTYAYYVGVSSLTLPVSPMIGDTLRIINRSGSITALILRNGSNIMGVADDVTFDELNGTYNFTYANTPDGWIISR